MQQERGERVEIRSAAKTYGAVRALDNVSLDIAPREFVSLLGPSGSGKTTLLGILGGFIQPSAGSIHFGGRDVTFTPPHKRDIGIVFQNYALFPHMTVGENVAFSLRARRLPKSTWAERVRGALAMVNLSGYEDRGIAQLSGGQRQRVAIGRAIVREPKVFLFDEPLSNLDAELRVQMRVEISRLHKKLGTTMIYVTHDQTEAMTLADKIVVLRGGNIEQIGAPLDLYDNPANQFVAGFVGSPKMNFVTAEVVGAQANAITIALSSDKTVRLRLPVTGMVEPGAQVTLGIRPEHFLDAGKGDADLTVTIDVAEHLGNTSYIYANIPGGEQLIIEQPESRTAVNRDTLTVGLSTARIFLFDSSGKRLR
jgi:lactose/L-arabinose transport system ATP-binding protein